MAYGDEPSKKTGRSNDIYQISKTLSRIPANWTTMNDLAICQENSTLCDNKTGKHQCLHDVK